jgi:hypothetical protein
MQVLVNRTGAVNVSVCTVRAASSITIDPLEPMFGTVSGDEILEIVGGRNALGVGCAEEVVLDGIGVVAKRDLDGAFETVEVAVVA